MHYKLYFDFWIFLMFLFAFFLSIALSNPFFSNVVGSDGLFLLVHIEDSGYVFRMRHMGSRHNDVVLYVIP